MLARKNRFHGHGSFNYLFKHGQAARGRYVLLRYVKNERRHDSRVGVIVSRKISKSAVVRNRIRRRVFEAVRINQPHLAGVYDMAFISLHKDLATIPANELRADIEMVLRRAHIWQQ